MMPDGLKVIANWKKALFNRRILNFTLERDKIETSFHVVRQVDKTLERAPCWRPNPKHYEGVSRSAPYRIQLFLFDE